MTASSTTAPPREERHAGTSPGRVILALTDRVDSANIATLSARDTVMQRVILWCVKAYFGHLGGDLVGANEASPDSPGDCEGQTFEG